MIFIYTMINNKKNYYKHGYFTTISIAGLINCFAIYPVFSQPKNCYNYWINPNTGITECFGNFDESNHVTPKLEPSELEINNSSEILSESVLVDFKGQNVESVREILVAQGFKVIVSEKLEENLASGKIIKQYPNPGTTLNKGSVVKLVVAKAPVYSIKGSFALTDSERVQLSSGKSCHGTGGYDDVRGNLPITIKDGSGKILATGQSESGLYSVYSSACVFEFEVGGIPKSDFYTIEVIGEQRGKLHFSFDEMTKKRWNVSLSLGN